MSKRTKLVTLAVVALFVAAVAVVLIVRQARSSHRNEETTEPTVRFGSFAADRFVVSGGRYSFYNGKTYSVTGIDVSSFQGEIDWRAVADDGIVFAFVRAGLRGYSEGNIAADESFEKNVTGAKEAGLSVGAYFFSQAVNEDEAREEARFVVDAAKDLGLDLPIVFDMEEMGENGRILGLTALERTNIANAFCAEVSAAGYESLVYASMSWLRDKVYADDLEAPIWLAAYTEPVSFPYPFRFWQYTHEGAVDGIDTPVDMNLMFLPVLESEASAEE